WHFGGTAGDDLWIVSKSARTYHWDGTSLYKTTQSLSQDDLSFIEGFGNEVWIAGKHDVLHFDGAAWSRSVVDALIRDLYVPGADRIMAVAGTQVLERRAGQWVVRDTSVNALWAID